MFEIRDRKNTMEEIWEDMLHKGAKFIGKVLRTDIMEEDNRYIVKIDVPDIKKEEIEIFYFDNTLSVKIDKKDTNSNKVYMLNERIYLKLERQYYLPRVKFDEIEVNLQDGVLTLILPIDVEIKGKKIEIK